MPKTVHLIWKILSAIGLVALFALALPAEGKQIAAPLKGISVDTLESEVIVNGNCSLPEAIQSANENHPVDACPSGDGASTDTITFMVSGVITMTNQLSVTVGGPLLIDGGSVITVISRNQGFHISTGAELTLNNIIISGICVGWYGCSGGIYNSGSLTITNSTLSHNGEYWGDGGCIFNDNGKLQITSSILSDNGTRGYGGAIWNNGTVDIFDSTISGNGAQFGGGIENYGTLTVTNSTLSDNGAYGHRDMIGSGGGIDNHGLLSISNSALLNNSTEISGGAISNAGTMTITNSTLSGNSANHGGGIWNANTITITYSTIVSNSASIEGGGIDNSIEYGGRVYLNSTIFAANTLGGNCAEEPINDEGYNLEDTDTCSFDPVNYSQPDTDPLIGPLQDNGGFTFTHALLAGSPAIDAGDPNYYPSSDQRGRPRPFDGDGDGISIPDAGSFEYFIFQYKMFFPFMGR
jgi:hypothetical protein